MSTKQIAPGQKKTKKPKTGLIRLAAAIAAILLLFGAGFFGVSAVLEDGEFIENEYMRLGTDAKMGISIPDLSNATRALFDYMKGRRADIRISVIENGVQVDDLFYHEKEVVHMEEVRALWTTLTFAAVIGIAAALGLLAAILFFGRPNTRLRNTGTGLLIGTLIFAGVMLAAGLWAIGDFNSFWTVFHFIIFPMSLIEFVAGGMTVEAYNGLSWVFESSFAMIRMLDELFLPLVLRAGILFGIEIAVMLLFGLICWRRGKRKGQVGSDVVDVQTVEQEERFIMVEDAPDLVLQHRLQNASLEQKKKLMEELRRTPEQQAQFEAEQAKLEAEQTKNQNETQPEEPKERVSAVPFADVLPDAPTEQGWERPRAAKDAPDGETIENDLF